MSNIIKTYLSERRKSAIDTIFTLRYEAYQMRTERRKAVGIYREQCEILEATMKNVIDSQKIQIQKTLTMLHLNHLFSYKDD